MAQAKLTPKQEAFCLAYIETGNASEAYRRAYNAEKMSDKVIHNKASDMAKRDDIGVRLEELRAPTVKRFDKTMDDILMELASVGFANLGDFVRQGANGTEFIPLDELPKELTAAISEMVIHETVGGTDKKPTVTKSTKLKLLPKIPALIKLGEHMGGLVKNVNVKGEIKHTVVDGTKKQVRDELENIFEKHGDASGNPSEDPQRVH